MENIIKLGTSLSSITTTQLHGESELLLVVFTSGDDEQKLFLNRNQAKHLIKALEAITVFNHSTVVRNTP